MKNRTTFLSLAVGIFLAKGGYCLGLEPPDLILPGGKASSGPTLRHAEVTFSWGLVTGATAYGLHIRDLNTKKLVVDTKLSGNQTVRHTAMLQHGHRYRWNMRSFADNGAGNFSAPLYFQIRPEKPAASLTFGAMTPRQVSTSKAPHDSKLFIEGANFNSVDEITFTWEGDSRGDVTWEKGDDRWRKKVTVHSDHLMTLEPRLVGSNASWSGTLIWTVTLRNTDGQRASKSFTVSYPDEQQEPQTAQFAYNGLISKYEDAFDEPLNDSQEKGLLRLFRFIREDPDVSNVRWAAYILATAKHEVGNTWKPIEEMGRGAGKLYSLRDSVTGRRYYGRGYVQLTWKQNYRLMSQVLGIDFVGNPALALEPEWAYEIMSYGMRAGAFTGIALPDVINGKKSDYINARRVVNGLDRAHLIADYAKTFERILREQTAQR